MANSNNTIFVSIASYRDNKCPTTILSCFEKAKNPSLITCGVCQQNKDSDLDCRHDLIGKTEYIHNVKIIRLKEYEAKGPTYARYLCSTLWDGEGYYLQIDSHTQFEKDWDEKLINMIKVIKEKGLSQKPVLSTYPKNYDDTKDPSHIPRLCEAMFNERDMISFKGAVILRKTELPVNTPFMAAGFFFCESKFLNEIPFDPNLPYLFYGEEIANSARFWTHGWDIFTPNENAVYHYYTRK